jgi:hypothetical protein
MRTRKLTLAALGCLLLWTVTVSASPAQKEHALKVGKKGEVTLTLQSKVGDIVLPPGTYVVQHRVSDGDHFVRFVELKQGGVQPATELPYSYTEKDKAGEVKCRVEPAAGRVKYTAVYTVTEGGVVRITKVEIRGEDVVHVF